jgi:hypothetical protein
VQCQARSQHILARRSEAGTIERSKDSKNLRSEVTYVRYYAVVLRLENKQIHLTLAIDDFPGPAGHDPLH